MDTEKNSGLPPFQWRISNHTPKVDCNRFHEFGPYTVALGDFTTCVVINDCAGKPIGCLLGEALDVEIHTFLSGSISFASSTAELSPAIFEQWLAGLAGTFVAFLQTPSWSRVYPSASHSCVYDLDDGAVASTPLALLDSEAYHARRDLSLVQSMEIVHGGWLPASLTAHRGVTRLLPNHVLDLRDWRVHRTWAGPRQMSQDPHATVTEIAQRLRATIAAVARDHRILLALTAGRDSRAVLAECRDVSDRLQVFTVASAGPDGLIPQQICQALNLPHRFLPSVQATQSQQQRWLMRTGHCMGGANLARHPSVQFVAKDEVVLTGVGSEVGRGFYWTAGDTHTTQLSARHIIRRLDLKPLPQIIAHVEQWLQGLRGQHDTYRILDLAYIELRLGCWNAPQVYGFPEGGRQLAPINQRHIFENLLALPPDWRRRNYHIDYLIEQSWSELCHWPYNRDKGPRQVIHLGRKLLSYDRLRRYVRRFSPASRIRP